MKKVLVGCLIALALAAIGSVILAGGCFLIHRGREIRRAEETREREASVLPNPRQADRALPQAITVTATALVQAYRENEVAADADYKDKVVHIDGVVASIQKGVVGETVFVTLKGGGFRNVRCTMSTSELNAPSLKTLRVGGRATVGGTVSGLMGDVQVNACLILPSGEPTALPQASLTFGQSTRLGSLRVTVLAAGESHTCPGPAGLGPAGPAQKAKFILIQAAAKNETADAADSPRIHFSIGPYDAGLYGVGACWSNEQAFSRACFRAGRGKLYPGAACEGWVLFEVPEGFDLATATLEATSGNQVARWQLR
jgi:hypothetical protein